MEKYKVGCMDIDEKINFFTDDFINFFDENDEKIGQNDLKVWALWLNSPWAQIYESYKIQYNCKDAYTLMNNNEPSFKCEYTVIGYDGISSSILGYGKTEEEALISCKSNFKNIQEKYNPKNESI